VVPFVVNAGSYSSFDTALGACPQSGPCEIDFPAGSWTSTFYSSSNCVSRSNLSLVGAAVPSLDSRTAPTTLTGGSIIKPGLLFCGASNVSIRDIGFDDGPAYYAATGIAVNGLAFEGATGAIGEPLVSNILVDGEIALGPGNNVPVHANLFEHIDGANLRNITGALATHCNVIKSRNVNASGLSALGCFTDTGVIIKADAYTNTGSVNVTGVSGSSVNPGDSSAGIVIDAVGSGILSKISVNQVTMTGVRFPVYMQNDSTLADGGISDVTISNVSASLNNIPGGANPSCIVSISSVSGSNSIENVAVSGFTCNNETTMAVAPLEIYSDWRNSSIDAWQSTNGSWFSTLGGSITIDGWLDGGTLTSTPTFCTQDATTVVNVYGYSTVRNNLPYSYLTPGSVINIYP
jgi:hypothetical protein